MAQQPAAALAEQPLYLDDYEVLDTIGEGAHAKVKFGRHLPTGTEVAIKIIQRRGVNRERRRSLQEAQCMLCLRHPNIVQLFQVIDIEESLFFVMEYVSRGDLWEHLEIHGRLAEGEARRIFRQLVSAVHYCHDKGVIHRDLKPQNVLLDINMNARLADFSMSTPFVGGKLSTFCGSPVYAAPELFQGIDYDGPPVDIWSLGVVLYHMVTGTPPFTGRGLIQLVQQIQRGLYSMPPFLTIELQHLLRKLITTDPQDRSSLREIMPDVWLNKGHVEELRPFTEPDGEDLDPEVEQKMVDMGFQREEIRTAVTQKAYDKTMATYLMLNAEKCRIPYRTILVRPYRSSDPNSIGGSPAQEAQTHQPPKDLESGQETRKAAPGPSPKSKKVSLQPSTKWVKVSPRHSPQVKTAIPRPSPKLRTATARASPKSTTASPTTSLKSRTDALPPNPNSDSDPDSDSDSRPTTPPPMPEDSSPTHPPPTAESGARPTPPPPTAEDSRPTPPPPTAEDSRPTRAPPTAQSRARPTHPPPKTQSRARPTRAPPTAQSRARPTRAPPTAQSRARPTPPPPTAKDSRPTSAPPMLEDSRPTRPPPMPEDARRTTPLPMPEQLRTTSPPLNREPKNATPRPAPQYGPEDSPSTHNTSSTRSSGSSRGSAEGKSQGRRGLARRCFNFLRKLCCLPPKKKCSKSS